MSDSPRDLIYFGWNDWSCCCVRQESAGVVQHDLHLHDSPHIPSERVSEAAIERLRRLEAEIDLLRARLRAEVAISRGECS